MASDDLSGSNQKCETRHITVQETDQAFEDSSRGTTTIIADSIVNMRSNLISDMLIKGKNELYATKDEDPDLRRSSDFRHKQAHNKRNLLLLAYQSIGVIYGDIGTSPLYVYSSTFSEAPSKQDLIGVLSLIIWSMSIMVTFKYVCIILYADNDGEGGSFSTYALLSRYLNITHRDPREATMVEMKRVATGELDNPRRLFRQRLERSVFLRRLLKVVGIIAVTAVIADGILTPAQSVLGAVQGIQVVKPGISKSIVIGVTDAILFFLFAIQPLGISRMTIGFSPIVIIWLGFNAVSGTYNLVKYDASVFRAFNPALAFDFLTRNGYDGWRTLGGVLLSFTGVEALFADLGAFNRQSIQLSWLCWAYPCLLLAYIGQAAYISVDPSAFSNPFFNTVPPGTLYPALVFALLAAIVASQAIITATFQLLAQVMKLSYIPQIKIIHTSSTFHGQLYIPIANWLLMIGCILVASIYNNTTSLGNAYGVCVMIVSFLDTSMVALTAFFIWRLPLWVISPIWLAFASHDSAYLSSALEKVPRGAWFTIALAAVLAIIFLIWRFGKEQQWAAEAQDRFPTSELINCTVDGDMHLSKRFGSSRITRFRGMGIFFDKAGETTPIIFSQFAMKLTALPDVMVFFHLRPLERPSVPLEERYSVFRLAIPQCYRLVVRHGYNDVIVQADLANVIHTQIRVYLLNQIPRNKTSLTLHNLEDDVDQLDCSYKHRVLYFVGKEQMKIRPTSSIFRKIVLSIFLWIRENTRQKIAELKLPQDQVIEVGFLKEI
ncbi:hypothetical protein CAC42_1 [Sphaceloma murrayae]|uniref:Potassium transporter 5 n=1 Tax=Sphaceloma murrayae TaxID=2082308 RepID=A0A2K1QS01_9PEZI|nr:hypothetical protein CAC42_1 [Sphaceloma murrayae]